MTAKDFCDIYYDRPRQDDSSPEQAISEAGGKVTHPIADTDKKHPKIACAWDAMGPLAGSGETGPMDGVSDGEGAGVGEGGGMGESVSPKQMSACLEAVAMAYPESEAIPQIMELFRKMCGNGTGSALYCGADGCETLDPVQKTCMCSDADSTIAAASAAVEAALLTFKRVAGYDYPGMKR